MIESEFLFRFLSEYLALEDFPDYPTALNGPQVEGPPEIHRIATAVDASAATIEEAVKLDAELLLVHHGIFWEGLGPLVGVRFRRVRALIEGRTGLYSVHLPLDAHPEIGNCSLLAGALGVPLEGRFGEYEGRPIGWRGTVEAVDRDSFRERIASAVEDEVRLIPGGPEEIRRVGVITGGGGSFVREAAESGLDAYVTGEGSHHTYLEAMELGVNLYYAGHYATEVFGVRALGELLAERFGIESSFIDRPTGM